jgi:hypothetical protein
MSYSPFPGPTPVYQNLPIQPKNYLPRKFFIENVQLGRTTTVTTTENLNYVIGQLVRLLIPEYSGCSQLNQVTAYVILKPNPNQVTINCDSSLNVNEFISTDNPNQPQIVAIGDINSGVISRTGDNIKFQSIPGAFINVS